MNSDFPQIRWRPIRGKTREKKNQLSIDDLDQIDQREELVELLEGKIKFNAQNQPLKKKFR